MMQKIFNAQNASYEIASADTPDKKLAAYNDLLGNDDLAVYADMSPNYAVCFLSDVMERMLPPEKRKSALLSTLASPLYHEMNAQVPLACHSLLVNAIDTLPHADSASAEMLTVHAMVARDQAAIRAAFKKMNGPHDDDWLLATHGDEPAPKKVPQLDTEPKRTPANTTTGSTHSYSNYLALRSGMN